MNFVGELVNYLKPWQKQELSIRSNEICQDVRNFTSKSSVFPTDTISIMVASIHMLLVASPKNTLRLLLLPWIFADVCIHLLVVVGLESYWRDLHTELYEHFCGE